MAKKQKPTPPDPALYAVVLPGLEQIAAEEIAEELGGEIKKIGRGLVVFRVSPIERSLLRLKTTEDVFLLAWGTDALTGRAADLKQIQRWTATEVNWRHLLEIHHRIRGQRGFKPTVHFVTQMSGRHVYRRADAQKALLRGVADRLPASWKIVDEGAYLEIWLTIHGRTAVCGVRLTDRTMRHRIYKTEHMPASLRPTVAAAMVRLAEARAGDSLLDPMCGAGTILAEQRLKCREVRLLGGDIDWEALRNSRVNLKRWEDIRLCRWDARRLPLASSSVDRIVCNPPFGVQLKPQESLAEHYAELIAEFDRVLHPSGRAVLLVADFATLQKEAMRQGWALERQATVRVLGRAAVISRWCPGGGILP